MTASARYRSLISDDAYYLDRLSGQINSIQTSGHTDRMDELMERIEKLEKQIKGKFYLDI